MPCYRLNIFYRKLGRIGIFPWGGGGGGIELGLEKGVTNPG